MLNPIPVLLYHHIGDMQGATSTALFSAHLNWLLVNGYRSLSLTEFKQRLKRPTAKPSTQREVLITFDDGFADLYDTALPVLERFNFKATAFLITGKIGTAGYVDWPAVLNLQNSGLFECHSHSHTHYRWQSAASITEDLVESRGSLAMHLNKPEADFDTLAWPWGACNEQWENLATDVGFTTQFLVQTAAVMPERGLLRLPRICCDAMPLWRFISVMQSLSIRLGDVPFLNSASIAYRRLRGGFGYQ